MLNQFVLVGRLSQEIIVENDKAIITLKVPRTFKNEDGEYENDFIQVIVSGNIATNTQEYCKVGDILGAKGRIQSTTTNMPDGTISTKMELFGEKITFLSSKSN